MSPRVFVLGDAVVDQLYFVPRLPEHGGEIAATNALMQPGGSASNVAVALRRLGAEVAFAARAGTDDLATVALSNIRATGVLEQWLQFDSERGTSVVALFVTPDAERTMVSAAAASRHLNVAGFTPGTLREFDAAVFSAYCFLGERQREYAEAVMADAQAAKKHIIIDIGTAAYYGLGREALLEACRGATYLLLNEHELSLLSGQHDVQTGRERLHAAGFPNLVVKLGANGSFVSTPQIEQHVPAVVIPDVVDTTGAGDAFTAGFAYGITTGLSAPEAARLGNAAGGLNTTAFGGQSVPLTYAMVHEAAFGASA